MKKKSQIRMGETIAVLIIFFFLLIIGVAFYINVTRARVISKNDEIFSQESIRVAQIVSFLPEVQCSSENIVTDNCYDLYKLGRAEPNLNKSNQYYFPFFYYSEIVIEEFYPDRNQWVLYNYTPTKVQGVYPTYIPISLYNATSKKYAFGLLSIMYYPYYGDA